MISLITVLCSIVLQICIGTTAVDRLEKLMQGNSKVVVGALYGSVETIRIGYGEGGVATSILTEIMGQSIMKLGSPYHDFPVATALHIAISQGKKEHLECVFFLMKTGASINSFIVPAIFNTPLSESVAFESESVANSLNDLLMQEMEEDNDNTNSNFDISIRNRPHTMSGVDYPLTGKADTIDMTAMRTSVRATAPYNISVRGYPPAMLYGLGLGSSPTNQHAAMLQRLYHTFPEQFNMTHIHEWCDATGNLPLLHMVVGLGFFDGLYVLVNDFHMDVNQFHRSGVSALHVAVWEGRVDMAGFLLHHGANMFAVDRRGRSPLHYAAIRGFRDIVSLMYQHSTNMHEFCKQLSSVDYDGKSPIDIAMNLRPRQALFAVELGFLVEYMCNMDLSRFVTSTSTSTSTNTEADSGTNTRKTIDSSVSFTKPPRCAYKSGWLDDSDSYTETNTMTKTASKPNSIDIIDSNEWYSAIDRDVFESDDDYIRSVSSVAVKHIYREYITTQRPVLIKGGERITARQRIWSQWDLEGFNDRYGGLLLKRGEELFFDYYVNLDSSFYRHSYITTDRYKTQERSVSEWLRLMRYDQEVSTTSGYGHEDRNSSTSCVNPDGTVARNRWNSPWEVQGTNPVMLTKNQVSDRLERLEKYESPVYDHGPDSRIQWQEEVVEIASNREELLYTGTGGGTGMGGTGSSGGDGMDEEVGSGVSGRSVLKEDLHAPFVFDKVCTTTIPSSVSKKASKANKSQVGAGAGATATEKDQYTEPYTISLGPVNTSYPMHAHNSTWHMLITGWKRWYIMSPGHSMYAFLTKRQIDEMGILKPSVITNSNAKSKTESDSNTEEMSNIKQFIMPVPEWFEKYGEYLISIGLVTVLDQYPGDLVYIPHNWAYTTYNRADSVSISQELCTCAHTDQRVYPVGSALYGGRDKYRRYNHPLFKMSSSKISNGNNNPYRDIDQSVPIFPQ